MQHLKAVGLVNRYLRKKQRRILFKSHFDAMRRQTEPTSHGRPINKQGVCFPHWESGGEYGDRPG